MISNKSAVTLPNYKFFRENKVRYSVHFQNTTKEWVLFDNAHFCMIPNRFKSENEAYTEAYNLRGSQKKKHFWEKNKINLNTQ